MKFSTDDIVDNAEFSEGEPSVNNTLMRKDTAVSIERIVKRFPVNSRGGLQYNDCYLGDYADPREQARANHYYWNGKRWPNEHNREGICLQQAVDIEVARLFKKWFNCDLVREEGEMQWPGGRHRNTHDE